MTRARDVADTQDNVGGAVAPFVAGKNKIINGDFAINQRNYTTGTTNGDYACDRNRMFNGDGTVTATLNAFTLGSAPVPGYEAKNFISIQSTGQTLTTANSRLAQDIESVRTFAGQTVTVSFWAKAASGTPKVAVELGQEFGTGGSPSSAVNTYAGQVTLSTSWARYSVTVAVPSISGKTLGTNGNDFLRCALWASAGSAFNSRTGSLGIQTNTINFWGLQVEAGSVATPFTTASGSIGGELALCQRYYWRYTNSSDYKSFGTGVYESTTLANVSIQNPVSMRIAPTSIDYANVLLYDGASGQTITSIAFNTAGQFATTIKPSIASGGTVSRVCQLLTANGSVAYLGFSAEL